MQFKPFPNKRRDAENAKPRGVLIFIKVTIQWPIGTGLILCETLRPPRLCVNPPFYLTAWFRLSLLFRILEF